MVRPILPFCTQLTKTTKIENWRAWDIRKGGVRGSERDFGPGLFEGLELKEGVYTQNERRDWIKGLGLANEGPGCFEQNNQVMRPSLIWPKHFSLSLL